MTNFIFFFIFIGVLLVSYFTGQLLVTSDNTNASEIQLSVDECNPAMSVCRVMFEQGEITVHFLQPPSALKPFIVKVTTGNIQAENIAITFVMSDMDMGLNIISLEQYSEQEWQGRAILPVCTLGRNDWVAELRIKNRNRVLRADFTFAVG